MSTNDHLAAAASILASANKVVVFTGAGISAESGIPTFRGKDGLWRNHRAEELATPHAFHSDPKKVWEWYDWRRRLIHDSEPNPAHVVIAEMEAHFPTFNLVTQNVDGLHKRAGSHNITELHGNLWRVRCMEEGRIFDFEEVPLKDIPPRCPCGALIRPDVVWFGEAMPVNEVSKAFSLAETCDTMLVVGTSAVVYPAAQLPFTAKSSGASIIEVNLEPTPVSSVADASFFGRAGEVLPRLWQAIERH